MIRAHVAFWFGVLVVLFLLTPLMRDGNQTQAFVEQELAQTRAVFGLGVGALVQQHAQYVFGFYTPADTLSKAAVRGRDMDLTRQIAGAPGAAAARGFNSYLQGLVLNLYVAALRLFIGLLWVALLLPVLIAAMVDGFAQRAIKRAEFGTIRPAAYAVTSLVVVPLAMAPLVYLVLPMAVTPLLWPLWAAASAYPLAAMVSNAQSVFGKD